MIDIDAAAIATYERMFISDNAAYLDQSRQWRKVARDKQIPPIGDWFIWLIRSGRGFGKTWTGAHAVIEFAAEHPEYPIAIIGQTKADVRDTMIEVGESSILKQSPDSFMPIYEPSKRRLVWPNGAIAIIYSGDEPDQLRGPQHGFAWVDELAKFKYPGEAWDNLEMGLRLGSNPRALVTTTPRPIKIIKQLLADNQCVDVKGSTFENEANLSAKFINRLRTKYQGTRLGRQELDGEILDDAPGALWKREEMIEKHRVVKFPDLVRIVVAIDPAVTSEEDSNQTGLIVAGVGTDKHGYVLDSKAIRDLPNVWAKEAVTLYNLHRADLIVGETNNGGDMIESTIRAVDSSVAYKKVHASRGKITRAEPIAMLYEQGRVHHVGNHAELEDQYCQWEQGMVSPDLLDAAVWALTELMLGDRDSITEGTAPDGLEGYRG